MWFTAALFFRSEHSDPNKEGLWEERIILLAADDEEGATADATKIGNDGEATFAVSPTDEVTWRFVGVERVHMLDVDAIGPGMEVFSRFLRRSEAESLMTPLD
jgi:hypothetical protein